MSLIFDNLLPHAAATSKEAYEETEHPFDWPVARVCTTFINFFAGRHGRHVHTPFLSSTMVPYNGLTLLFANPGMNQYKPLLMGTCDTAFPMM